jgi:hypothetical protein
VDVVDHPELIGTAIDATDVGGGESGRRCSGTATGAATSRRRRANPDPRADHWLVLCDDTGRARVAVQPVDDSAAVTWPDPAVPSNCTAT